MGVDLFSKWLSFVFINSIPHWVNFCREDDISLIVKLNNKDFFINSHCSKSTIINLLKNFCAGLY
jgi:hypothetical protein